jgi:hypothetical protein
VLLLALRRGGRDWVVDVVRVVNSWRNLVRQRCCERWWMAGGRQGGCNSPSRGSVGVRVWVHRTV